MLGDVLKNFQGRISTFLHILEKLQRTVGEPLENNQRNFARILYLLENLFTSPEHSLRLRETREDIWRNSCGSHREPLENHWRRRKETGEFSTSQRTYAVLQIILYNYEKQGEQLKQPPEKTTVLPIARLHLACVAQHQ